MDKETDLLARAFREFVENIARLNAHGDRLEDGAEVVWDDSYAQAQLWEIIYNARLIAGTCPTNASAHHTPHRRATPHADCVKTYPDAAFDK